MNRTIIGLAGVKTSGKSTVADIITKLIGGNITESALAGKLKDVSASAFGLTREYFDNQNLKETPFEDGPKTLTLDIIEDILLNFNTLLTKELIDIYTLSGIIDMKMGTPRVIAQIVGTEVLRATGNQDIHCENMPTNAHGVTIVSDLRFPNEFTYFDKNEDITFLPLYIQRTEAEDLVTEDSHLSERSVFDFSSDCICVPNNSSLEDLELFLSGVLLQAGYIQNESKEA